MGKIIGILALCAHGVCSALFGILSVIFFLWAYARRFAEEIGDWPDFKEEYGQPLCSFGLSLITISLVSIAIIELIEKNKNKNTKSY